MQKKSLLVALFCGALCLTGCLKNEESASVALVRGAKAEELKSLAALNNAKAAAEAVYAEAELTVAKAEAELRKAQAALILAQAETEKVRAELLKVRVALAEVEVEEEKVKLQKMEAELEQKLAEVEAAVAKAEREKQKYINDLEHLMAQAEIQAVKDAQKLLEAEDALEEYLLKQEGEKLDSAKAYSVKYFYALNQVQTLQKQQIQTKATKALVEAGAMEIRDVIHAVMDDIDEQIAEKEELVAYLQEHQNMKPEEAEEALKEARIELEDAYNAYKAAQEAESDAKTAFNNVDKMSWTNQNGMLSAFTYDWENQFTRFISRNWPYIREKSYEEFDEDYDLVKYSGYYDRNDGTKFIKLWKGEQTDTKYVFYPTLEEQSVRNTFNTVNEMVIAPAEIFYDNVEIVLDSIENRKKKEVAAAVNQLKTASANKVKGWQTEITNSNKQLALHQEYVDARKDTIAKLEHELDSLVNAYNTSAAGKATAVEAYQKYMMVHYEVPTSIFEAEIKAANDTVTPRSEYVEAFNAWNTMKSAYNGQLKTNRATALENQNKAAAAYAQAAADGSLLWSYERAQAYWDAYKAWSPVFEGTWSMVEKGKGNYGLTYYKWKKGVETVDVPFVTNFNDGTHSITTKLDTAGTTQKTWIAAADAEEIARVAFEKAQKDYADNPTSTNLTEMQSKRTAYINAVATTETAVTGENGMDAKQRAFESQDRLYKLVWSDYETAIEDYNPNFAPDATHKAKKDNDGWYIKVGTQKIYAGTAQANYCEADSAYRYAGIQVNNDEDAEGEPTLKAVKDAKEEAYDGAVNDWKAKFHELVVALETTEKDYKADPEVARLLAETKKATETMDKVNAKFGRLQKRYGIEGNPADGHGHLTYLNYLAPDAPYTDNDKQYNGTDGMSWLNSNYHLNPEYQFIYFAEIENGKAVIKKKTAAEAIYGKTGDKPNTQYSLTSIVADRTQKIADEPAELKRLIDATENSDDVKSFYKNIEDIKSALKEYQSYEAAYKTWVANREEAFEAWQEARKDTYDAKDAQKEALTAYEGVETLANGGMWVYDPDAELYMEVYNKTSKPNKNQKGEWEDGFTFIEVNDAIEAIEGSAKDLSTIFKSLSKVASTTAWATTDMRIDDREVINILKKISPASLMNDTQSIAELNFTKTLLEEALKYGKVALEVIIEAYDAEIAEYEEKITFWSALAESYKALMNAWLGIVDEAVVEEPVEEEGDDEE